jgi:enolase-phosphatase E1
MIKVIVTDIEGTTSSISFVKEVLFPYARERMGDFIRHHAERPEIQTHLAEVRRIAETALDQEACIRQLIEWIDEDRKATPLKALQGLIWDEGYRLGHFYGHLYPDAFQGLKRWHDQKIPLYIFSSGSIKAQKLLFSHTPEGDLTPWISGYFDTTTGPKQEASSYQTIANAVNVSPREILFLSDIEGELDAAQFAGYQTRQLVRDPEMATSLRHTTANSFDEIDPMTL